MNIELIENEGQLELYVPSNKTLEDIKEVINKIKKSEIKVVKTDRLNLDQSKLIWVLCGEYGDLTGYTREEMREVLENEFCNQREIEYFSISPFKKDACSLQVATEFIQFIIEHSINNGFNLVVTEGKGNKRKYKSTKDIVPDIRRYILACLLNKRCPICGSYDVDLHHWDSVASIGGYAHDDGLKTRFIPLCRKHHTEFHTIGIKDFENKYHVNGVWLSENLVRELKKIYPNHFKAFKED